MNRLKRRKQILHAAVKVAEKTGYLKVTRDEVARRANVSQGLIQYHFNSIDELRGEIIAEAVKEENVAVIAQGLGNVDAAALDASDVLKEKAFEYIRRARV